MASETSTANAAARGTGRIRHVLSALVQNQPGVLAHVSGMFASRGFNIDSLAVGETEAPHLSRITVVVRGDEIALPLKEFELLELLLANAGRVLTRDTLIDRIWGNDYVGDTKTLDVHIKRLRARVEDDPARPTRILTIRGLGYRYDTPRPQEGS